jgi:hypothetical protein
MPGNFNAGLEVPSVCGFSFWEQDHWQSVLKFC